MYALHRYRSADDSLRFDFGTFNEITSQLDPEKFEEQMTKAGWMFSEALFHRMHSQGSQHCWELHVELT